MNMDQTIANQDAPIHTGGMHQLRQNVMEFMTDCSFPDKHKKIIHNRASLCQLCLDLTECGECAHIVAAGKKGPRNKESLILQGLIDQTYDIKSPDNGLFLCPNCHKMIDRNPKVFTYDFLKEVQKPFLTCIKPKLVLKIELPTTSSSTDLLEESNRFNSHDEKNSDIMILHDELPRKMQIHLKPKEEKPEFLCSLCGQSFKWINHMYAHRKNKCKNRQPQNTMNQVPDMDTPCQNQQTQIKQEPSQVITSETNDPDKIHPHQPNVAPSPSSSSITDHDIIVQLKSTIEQMQETQRQMTLMLLK